jgi:hypothetical protein
MGLLRIEGPRDVGKGECVDVVSSGEFVFDAQ